VYARLRSILSTVRLGRDYLHLTFASLAVIEERIFLGNFGHDWLGFWLKYIVNIVTS
jgi:hypothetical protein